MFAAAASAAALAASAAGVAEAASAGMAADAAASASGAAAGSGATIGAGATTGAGASAFLPQAAKAAAAIIAAKTSDLFIFKIPDELTKQFLKFPVAEGLQLPSKPDYRSFHLASNYK
ncbi:MAG: hypothetical protein ACI9I0_000674 [Rhodoferax sp.]|jgi:hypothetical protein